MSRLLAACLALGILTASTPAREDEPKTSKMSQKIVEFARARLGKKVGDGECTSLAIAALKSVGAKTTYDYGISGLDKDYKWGRLLKDPADAQPGDIIQFRDVVTVTKTVTKTAGGTTTRTMTRNYPHHTAIVEKNLGKGKLQLLEQNAGEAGATEEEKRKVQENPFNLAGKTGGKVWVYRPVTK
jgi:hypothetical protein